MLSVKNPFFGNVVSMLSGTLMVQSIPVIASIVITRLYSPAEFGIFSTWLAVVTIIATLITLRFETALVIVDDDNRSHSFWNVLIIIWLIMIVVSVCFVFLLIYDVSIISLPLIMQVLLFPSGALVATCVCWQNKAAADGSYKKLIKLRLIQVFVVSGLQVILGILFLASAMSLAVAYSLGFLVSLICYPLIYKIDFHDYVFSLFEIKRFFSRYRNFALWGVPSAAANVFSNQMPVIIIAALYGSKEAGLFALTVRVLGIPLRLLSTAVLDVFKRTATLEFKKTGQCQKEFMQAFYILLLGAIFLGFGTLLLGESIFVIGFGEDWRKSGEIAMLLLPLFTMRFVASPLSYMVFIAEMQHIDLIWQIFLLLGVFFVFYAGCDFNSAIRAYALMCAFLYFVYLIISYKYAKN